MGSSRAPYSLLILYRDWFRFLPALLAVGFSAVLIAVQCGLVMGLLVCTSVPIDHAAAEIWAMTADAYSLQQTYPIPDSWLLRLAREPEIVRAEPYLVGEAAWHKPSQGSTELCFVIGMRLDDDSVGAIRELGPELRARLTEPGTIVVDNWELPNLGLRRGTGEIAEINGQRVRIAGTLNGFEGHNFIYVFCSMQTARQLVPRLRQTPNDIHCVLARCRDPRDVPKVVQRLRQQYPDMGVYSRDEFARRARIYWLSRSRGGMVMVCTIILALLVGLMVTSQTLYAAVLASLKEYAVLEALGIPRWRVMSMVLSQSFWIGAGGLALALPLVWVLSWATLAIRTRVLLENEILVGTAVLTLAIALLSGASALRPLRRIEPAELLR